MEEEEEMVKVKEERFCVTEKGSNNLQSRWKKF